MPLIHRNRYAASLVSCLVVGRFGRMQVRLVRPMVNQCVLMLVATFLGMLLVPLGASAQIDDRSKWLNKTIQFQVRWQHCVTEPDTANGSCKSVGFKSLDINFVIYVSSAGRAFLHWNGRGHQS